MPSYNSLTPKNTSALVLVEAEPPRIQFSLSLNEAQDLLSRVVNSREEDTAAMTSVILRLANAIREANRAESEAHPTAAVA